MFQRPHEAVIVDREVPRPKKGELLVETSATLISTGTELTIFSGDFPQGSAWARYGVYPFAAGYSNIGVVREVGEGVESEWLGRRVATRTPHAAWVTFPAAASVAVPENVSDEEAAFFAIAGIVMNGVRRSNLTWGESVAIFGLGLLGQFAVRFCHLAGAAKIFAIDVAKQRSQLLPDYNAIVAINPRDEKVPAKIRDCNHNRLAQIVFEVTGDPSLIPGEFAALRRQGRFVVLSSPRGATNFDFHDLCNFPSYNIIGAHESSISPSGSPDHPWTRPVYSELFFDYLTDGRLKVEPLISDRIAGLDAPAFYESLLKDRSGHMGVILNW